MRSLPFKSDRLFSPQRRQWLFLEIGSLLVIAAFAAYLRLSHLDNSPLWGDQSILYSIALDWVNGADLPLAANKSSSGAMNTPVIEYLIAIPLFLHKSLYAPLIFQGILSLGAMFAAWMILRQASGRYMALLGAGFFAVNPWLVYFTRHLWNPNHVPIFASLLFASVLAALVSRRPYWTVLSLVMLAITVQLHLSGLVLIMTVLLIALIFHRRLWRGTWPQTLWPLFIGLGLSLVLALPYLIYERSVGFQDVRILLDVFTGSQLSETAFVPEPQVNLSSVKIMLDLTSGSGFYNLLPETLRPAPALWLPMIRLLQAASILGLFYALINPIRWRLSHRNQQLPPAHLFQFVTGIWIVVPVIFYLRHTQYLQTHFFLWLFPPLLFLPLIILPSVNISASSFTGLSRLPRRMSGSRTPGMAQLSNLLPFVAIVTLPVLWLALQARASLNYVHASGSDGIFGDFALGDLHRAAKLLQTETPAECGIILIAPGQNINNSPIGMLEPLLHPLDVRIASSGRGLIIADECASLFVASPDAYALDYLTTQGRQLEVANTSQGLWRFFALDNPLPPKWSQPKSGKWQNGLDLVGIDLVGDVVAGGSIQLRAHWDVLQAPPLHQDYHFFVHLLDGEGNLVLQDDTATVHPVYWRQGDRLITTFYLNLPSDMPAGSYAANLGMYSWPNIIRIPLDNGSDSLSLAEWTFP